MTLQDREFNYSIFQSYYGIPSQKNKAIEEMAELTKELCKDIARNGNVEEITKEIADVEVMLEQLKVVYDIDQSEIDKIKEEKILKAIGVISKEMRGGV